MLLVALAAAVGAPRQQAQEVCDVAVPSGASGCGEEALPSAGQLSREPASLAFGTADPHGVGDVDRAPRSARRACFDVAAHAPATPAELAARAFPLTNAPPSTLPSPPPLPQPSPAPLVLHVEQVIAPAGLQRVHWWLRQMRRCYHAAEAGELSRARRLRPPDMWLDHAIYSVPATAAWDWDLRPLAHGLPAVPLPVSGRRGVLPATDIALAAVSADAPGFADGAIVGEMLSGVEDDSLCQRGTLLCAPHAGALACLAVALEKTSANVSKGWATGGHTVPCWPLRTCPFSVVDESLRAGKPKFRLTTDLSWPHPGSLVADGVGIDSVNDGMDRSRWPVNRLVTVGEYAEALAVLHGGVGRRVRAWGMDCEAFYRVAGRQRRELWRNGICLPDGVQLDERCCFGDASAATKCARISNFLVFQVRRALAAFDEQHPTREPGWLAWQAARRTVLGVHAGGLSTFSMYIDDGMGGSADDLLYDSAGCAVVVDGGHQRRASAHYDIARAVVARYGWQSAPGKEQPPALVVDALGVQVSLVDDRLRLSGQKRDRYSLHAAQVADMRTCSFAEYEQLLGRLQFAAQCYPLGRQRLHAAQRLARARFRLAGDRVRITRSVARDLHWWVREMRSADHEGVPLARHIMAAPGEGAGALYADASGEGGFAAWTLCGDEVIAVGGLWSQEERGMLICELELLASTFGSVALAPWLPADVYTFTDNTVAQAALRRFTATTAAMQTVVARRTRWFARSGRLEAPRRITSAANVWADVGSRPEKGGMLQLERLALAAGFSFRAVDVPADWRDTSGLRLPEPSWGGH